MTKRLTLVGVVAVAVVWGPYVYAELARRPLPVASPEPQHVVVEPTPVAYAPATSEHQPLIAAPALPVVPNLPEQPAAVEEPPPAAAVEETTTAAATEPRPADLAGLVAATEQAAEAPKPSAAPEEPAAEAPAAAKPEPDSVANKPAEEKHEDAPSPESLAPAFRSTFDREARDAQWASSEEPRLTELLSGAGVPASAIAEVRCQSTVCRIALNSVDVQAVQQSPLYHLLYQRVRDEFGPMLGLDPTSRDGEQHAALYVLRKGYELPSSRD